MVTACLILMVETEEVTLGVTLQLHVKRTVLVLSGAHHHQTVTTTSVTALTLPAPDSVVTVQ